MPTKPLYTIDEDRHEIRVGKNEVHLATKEFDLLLALKQSGKTMSREDLFAAAWPSDARLPKNTRTVDQHIARLRRKLSVPAVITVPNRGYKIAA